LRSTSYVPSKTQKPTKNMFLPKAEILNSLHHARYQISSLPETERLFAEWGEPASAQQYMNGSGANVQPIMKASVISPNRSAVNFRSSSSSIRFLKTRCNSLDGTIKTRWRLTHDGHRIESVCHSSSRQLLHRLRKHTGWLQPDVFLLSTGKMGR
jgi:hypothetical protein